VLSTSTSADSVPDWSPFVPPRAPEGAPNLVYIVLDDVGFSAMDCYGGPLAHLLWSPRRWSLTGHGYSVALLGGDEVVGVLGILG
jgi:hypothetical protein